MRKDTILFLFALLVTGCTHRQPFAEWTEGPKETDGRALHTLTLHHVPQGARVWFQELYDGKTFVEGPVMHHYQGTTWHIDIPSSRTGGPMCPPKNGPMCPPKNRPMNPPPSTITLKYYGRPLPRQRWAPEGFVLQQKGKPDMPMEIVYHFQELPPEEAPSEDYACLYKTQPVDIIPQIKRIQYGLPRNDKKEKPVLGGYRITIDVDGNPTIEADDEDGAFYAQTTLERLPKPLQPMTLEDWPDYPFRGFMLDVARDFRSVDEVLQIIDLIASWKMNVLHFHLADDESWCLEIKDFPELTDYGAHHALPDWDLEERSALKPTINGRIGNATFYTAQEYQRIIKYAWERRIRVIPEFDTPGHSRASIKAMQAYERRTGDSSFRLQDPADTSHYWSAQDYTDNVLSVDLPSVYRFYGTVFDEVIRLHQEVDVPLPAIHIGGDEVPEGAWSGKDRHEMKELFINGMLDLAEERGILIAGWEDIAKGLEPETEERLKQFLYYLDVWNTNGIEGFPVVLTPASHTYLDLAYSSHPKEIGLHWAGYVDTRKTFSLNPSEYKGEILGVQASLWSSQLRSFDDATYQMLPKALGVAERGWNRQSTDFNRFYSIIVEREMPVWKGKGFLFKKNR